MNKPRVFIASSRESLPVTKAINANLDHDYEVTAWNTGSFILSTTTIDNLVKKSSTTDFAVFVFNPDDLLFSRGQSEQVVRDNVLFELGLFIGAIGVERCFIVKPRGQDLKLPSDLLGITMADYEPERSDDNFDAALGSACYQMEGSMKKLGSLDRKALRSTQKLIANPANYSLNSTSIKVLANCLETHTSLPEGKTFNRIAQQLQRFDEEIIRLQLIKLERMSLIEKEIAYSDFNGEPYYSYSITEAGIDCVLENEDMLVEKVSPPNKLAPLDDFPDDIPF